MIKIAKQLLINAKKNGGIGAEDKAHALITKFPPQQRQHNNKIKKSTFRMGLHSKEH
ncbi:hypothetical protein N9H46_02130 [Hellea sp.]|jgi:hypothetical protein|nr:hypothetical protein [Hellea sp.]MDA9048058.1 hypothetical protein [Hellea sp.]